MTIEELKPLYAAMLAADREYKRAEPDAVHIAHAEFKARRFAFNRASGEFVAALIESKKPIDPVVIERSRVHE